MREAPATDSLSRWALRIAGLLALLVILVALNAMLRGGEENPFNPNPIAAAAEQTRVIEGARMTTSATIAAAGQTMTMSGTGAYSPSGRSQIEMTMQTPPPTGAVEMEVVGSEEMVYVRSPLFATMLPAGKEWLAIDPSLGSGDAEALTKGTEPREQLEMLRAVSGTVVELGTERVRGALTTRYRGTIDLDRYAGILRDEGEDEAADLIDELDGGGTGSVEAWIDRRGTLRKARVVTSIPPGPGMPPVSMDMLIELYDFGAEPAIALPDPALVFDVTALAAEQLDL